MFFSAATVGRYIFHAHLITVVAMTTLCVVIAGPALQLHLQVTNQQLHYLHWQSHLGLLHWLYRCAYSKETVITT